jgi:hypothetical protein
MASFLMRIRRRSHCGYRPPRCVTRSQAGCSLLRHDVGFGDARRCAFPRPRLRPDGLTPACRRRSALASYRTRAPFGGVDERRRVPFKSKTARCGRSPFPSANVLLARRRMGVGLGPNRSECPGQDDKWAAGHRGRPLRMSLASSAKDGWRLVCLRQMAQVAARGAVDLVIRSDQRTRLKAAPRNSLSASKNIADPSIHGAWLAPATGKSRAFGKSSAHSRPPA